MRTPDPAEPVPDTVLLARYARGEAGAAQVLAARLVPRVLAFATRMLGDATEAEDVAQDAMLRLWQAAPGWHTDGAAPATWLYRVTANLCIDRLRKRRRGPTAPLDSVPEPHDGQIGAAARMIAAQRVAALQEALQTLPERQRQAVILRHIEGLSNPEIAQIMALGIEAVESLTARGKRALKAALAARRDELGFDDDRP